MTENNPCRRAGVAPIITVMVDPSGRVTFCNRLACKTAGDVDEAAAEEARKEAEHALANQSGDFDYGRASSQLAEAAAQLATLRKMKNRAGRG
mgnify:CR=1 FL=1